MKFCCAFDSFKDSASSLEVGNAVKEAIHEYAAERNMDNSVSCTVLPLSDGGEGFLSCFRQNTETEMEEFTLHVSGPFGIPIDVTCGVLKESGTVVMEMATICGLELVPFCLRNPKKTTTLGVGQAIRQVYEKGYRKIILGIGGSATNDGGVGALQGLGFSILMEYGYFPESKPFCGEDLLSIKGIEGSEELKTMTEEMDIMIACDVTNPFIGCNGAVNTFAEQKGANEEDRILLEQGMLRLADVFEKEVHFSRSLAGSGAAGGIGSALYTFLGGKLKRGAEIIAESVGLLEHIRQSDILFSGEGSYDSQSKSGKAVSIVQHYCSEYSKPLIIICGKTGGDIEEDDVYDLVSYFSVEDSMNHPMRCMKTFLQEHLLRKLF